MKTETKTNIINSALTVFSKKGYHGASISDITKSAKVSKALFYHYFKTKKDLLVYFATKRLEDFFPLVDGMKKIQAPKERLMYLINFVLDELVEKTKKLQFITMLYLTGDGAEAIGEAMESFKEEFAIIQKEEEKLFKDLGYKNPNIEATYLRSLLQGISLEYMLCPPAYPLKEIQEQLFSKYNLNKEESK